MKTTETEVQSAKRRPFLPGNREIMIEAIRESWPQIIAKEGSVMLTAKQVLNVLQSEGLLSETGRGLVGANSVGDVLGAKHFKLPFLQSVGKRTYLMPAVGWTPQEIAAFEEFTPADKLSRLKDLENEFVAAPPGDEERAEGSSEEVVYTAAEEAATDTE